MSEPTKSEQKSQKSKLTAENLQKHETVSKASRPQSKALKQKPAWARTEKQQEQDKEEEIDDLLEFAYDLDYEKYLEDYEVRQALALIKDRVKEITQEVDWKQKMADEWNQTVADDKQKEVREVKSQVSQKSNMSKASYASRVSEAKRREA